MDLHDLLKSYKHGFSKVTDHATREIRHGRLTRDEGLALVRHYEHAPIKNADKFCEWLGVNLRGLNFIIDHHRNSQFWKQEAPGVWLSDPVEQYKEQIDIGSAFGGSIFIANSGLNAMDNTKYITIGKGWP
jgi:hypothetical protein